MSSLLKIVRENCEDFEWYPTTNEIITALYTNICSSRSERIFSLLDIGGGNGKIFATIDSLSNHNDIGHKLYKKYVIEKSKTLINSMESDICIVGTDFWEQTLIDKKVDVIYSNPPYSEFEAWSEKIILEANAQLVYLCIPDRWTKSKKLKEALEKRGMAAEVIGNFSFENAEDRAARVRVDLIKIKADRRSTGSDPFKIWFDNNFDFDVGNKYDKQTESSISKERESGQLVKGNNLIERLEELYAADMDRLLKNYQSLSEIDGQLLRELGVSKDSVREGLYLKIDGLKNLYWKELFNNLDKITDRLTFRSRESLLNTLTGSTNIDFTANNIYAVVIWAIKNANIYYEKQMCDLYYTLSSSANVKTYKSNHRFIRDGWRYSREEMSHYSLDYQFIHERSSSLASGYRSVRGLGEHAVNFVGDIIAVAGNLGFKSRDSVADFDWLAGRKNIFMISDNKSLMEIKVFGNGNFHIKFSTDFMAAFNIEAGRVNNWIKSPSEAAAEMGVDIKVAEEYFGSNFALTGSDMPALLGY